MKRRPFQGLSHVVHLGQEVVPWKIMMPKQRWVYGSSRPAILAESQPALKFRVNRPDQDLSRPGLEGRRACVLVFFFSRQLGS